MANSSGSESDETPGMDWAILEDELSAGALQSLRQHLKVKKLIDLWIYMGYQLQLECMLQHTTAIQVPGPEKLLSGRSLIVEIVGIQPTVHTLICRAYGDTCRTFMASAKSDAFRRPTARKRSALSGYCCTWSFHNVRPMHDDPGTR